MSNDDTDIITLDISSFPTMRGTLDELIARVQLLYNGTVSKEYFYCAKPAQ